MIDRACKVGTLGPGAMVLEIGCGTGQLTRSLVERGLRVTAIEPGERLIARAHDRLGDTGEVEFVNGRLEETSLPRARYSAAFSASAIHWVDPDVSWRAIADALVDGGTLALVSYFGLHDPHSAGDQQALRAAMARVAPELAAEWPSYHGLDCMLAGAEERRGNVSEVWAWLGGYELARRYAADLFDDTHLATVPTFLEHTADALNDLVGTMSSLGAALTRAARRSARREPRPAPNTRPADPFKHRRLPGNGSPCAADLTAVDTTSARIRRPTSLER